MKIKYKIVKYKFSSITVSKGKFEQTAVVYSLIWVSHVIGALIFVQTRVGKYVTKWSMFITR